MSGVDVPRWNNQLPTKVKVEAYLQQPAIYFVLFDTVERDKAFPLRVRVWKVEPRRDKAFRNVVAAWSRGKTSGNFQLHPPCWRDTNVATNNAGNLELPLLFKTQQIEIGEIDYMEIRHYSTMPGRCRMVTAPSDEQDNRGQ